MDWKETAEGVPLYSKSGRTLTPEERNEIAKKRGICVSCGAATYDRQRFRRKALTNDDVYNGICIRCHPGDVPADVLDAWNARSRRNVRLQQQAASARPIQQSRPIQHLPRTAISLRPVQTLNGNNNNHMTPRSPSRNLVSPPTNTSVSSPRVVAMADRPSSLDTSPSSRRQLSTPLSRRGVNSSAHNLSSSSMPSIRLGEHDDFASQIKQYSLAELVTACGTTSNHWNETTTTERLILVLEAIKNFPLSIGQAPETRSLVTILAGIIEQNRTTATTTTTTGVSDPYNPATGLLTAAVAALWRVSTDENANDDGETGEEAANGNTMKTDHAKQIIIESGVSSLLVDTLRKHSAVEHASFVECVIGTLTSLAMHGPTMRVIAQADATEIVLEKLEQGGSDHAGILEWACRCLLVLVRPVGNHRKRSLEADLTVQAEAERNGATIEESRGVSILVHAMKSHTTESQAVLWGVKLLCHLLESCSVDVEMRRRFQAQMVENGFVQLGERIVRARSTSGALFAHTAELLVRLVNFDSNDSEVDLSECVPSVVRVMDKLNEDLQVQKAGCRVLASLKTGNPTSMMGRGLDATHAILAALKSRPDNLSLAESGCCALSKIIASNPSVMDDPSLASRTTISLAELVEKHKDSKSVLLWSCCCLGSLTRHSTADSHDPHLTILQQAIVLHADDPFVVDTVVENLIALFEVDPEYCEVLFHSLELDRVVRLGHVTNELTTWRIYLLSAMLASRSDVVRETLLRYGALPSAAAQLQNAEEEAFQTTLLNYIRLLATSKPIGELNVPQDLIENICRIIGNRSASENFVFEGCFTLCALIQVSLDMVSVDAVYSCMIGINAASPENVRTAEGVCNVFWALASKCPEACGRNIDRMFRLCAEYLKKHSSEQAVYEGPLMTSAAAALVNITAVVRTVNPIVLNVADVDAAIASVYKIFENDSDGSVPLADLLVVLENLYFVAPEILIEAGLIVVMIDVMAERENCALVQERGCRLLSSLAAEESLQINLSIIQTEGVDILCAALSIFRDNTAVQSHACKAFAHLSVDEESKVLILLQGGFQLAVTAVKSHRENKGVLKSAWMSLLRLTEGSHTTEDVIIESEVIQAAVVTLKTYPHEKLLQEYCIGVIGNISTVNDKLRRSIVEAGAIDVIFSSVEEWLGTPSTTERSLSALAVILRSMENNSSFRFDVGVKAVVAATLALIDYDNVQARACACLETLGMLALSRADKALMLSTGALETVFYSMQAHYSSVTVQTTACRALAELTTNVTNHSSARHENLAIVATEGHVRCLLSAMRWFPAVEAIQASACAVFRNFLLCPDNALVIKRSKREVKSVLNKAASRYPILCTKPVGEALSILQS